ncbi:unnamed protein product, partial [marine sediment metagenome]
LRSPDPELKDILRRNLGPFLLRHRKQIDRREDDISLMKFIERIQNSPD